MSAARSTMDPLWVLWQAMDRPVPSGAPQNKQGYCSRCGAFDEAASRVKVVVSDKFTGWDDYTQHSDPIWCTACTWGHTESRVRTRAWCIGGGRTIQADASMLAEVLSGPIPALVAVVVPQSRHKHLLPAARWGVVTTDDRHLVWEHEEARLFGVVRWLRGLGFGEAALLEPTPRFEQLTRQKGGTMALVMTRWEDLAVWRRDPAYLKVACLASRKTPEPA